ncbi:MFS transporter [Thermocrispum sp.]|jgi:MFS family permease|uniref:MFS transporter n=2 Tax=Thermocrispum agreste TaxID=37925 RepID=A0ABD6FGD8_9PSEU|nr:MFS transporter [Thermocrispum sp.]
MSTVLVEPTENVRWPWTLRYNTAWVGVMVGFYGPIQVLLPNQAEAIAAESKETVLAWVFGVGAAFSTVFNPLWGALSDRTLSRFGRRLPWIAVGGLAGAASLVLLSAADTVAELVIGWCLVQTALNAPWAALTAVVPDQVPRRQRGTAAGYLGLAQMLGVVIATGLAGVLPGAAGYLACAVVLLVSLVPFLLQRRDPPLPPEQRPPWDLRAFLRGFWVSPRRYPDFGWAWLTRFLLNLSNGLLLAYLLYYLRDELGIADAEGALLVLTVVNVLGVMAAVLIAGVWSDRLARRKVFVIVSGLIMAAAAFLLAGVATYPVAIIAAAVVGIGFGVYTSVDFALITQVLPAAADRGKDLGVLNISNTLPQVVAPALAAPLVTQLGGYPALFAASGLVAVLGAVLVGRITSVA